MERRRYLSCQEMINIRKEQRSDDRNSSESNSRQEHGSIRISIGLLIRYCPDFDNVRIGARYTGKSTGSNGESSDEVSNAGCGQSGVQDGRCDLIRNGLGKTV